MLQFNHNRRMLFKIGSVHPKYIQQHIANKRYTPVSYTHLDVYKRQAQSVSTVVKIQRKVMRTAHCRVNGSG